MNDGNSNGNSKDLSSLKEQQAALLAERHGEPLNDFSHRIGKRDDVVLSPEDVVTQATPAQRERIVYLVDDAISTVGNLLSADSHAVQLKAAENILDRAGMGRVSKVENTVQHVDIPSDALVGLFSGMAKMFNVESDKMRTVEDSGKGGTVKVKTASGIEDRTQGRAKTPSEVAGKPPQRSKGKGGKSTKNSKKEAAQSLPDSLMNRITR